MAKLLLRNNAGVSKDEFDRVASLQREGHPDDLHFFYDSGYEPFFEALQEELKNSEPSPARIEHTFDGHGGHSPNCAACQIERTR